ncbi:12816_t:CDS:2, partial [Entrophospora sp. SA101]
LSKLNPKVLNRGFSCSKDGREILERAWQAEIYCSFSFTGGDDNFGSLLLLCSSLTDGGNFKLFIVVVQWW